jgi:hypothetical protein
MSTMVRVSCLVAIRHRFIFLSSENTVITLADWWHKPAPEVAAQGPPFLSDATLINGKGRSLQTVRSYLHETL